MRQIRNVAMFLLAAGVGLASATAVSAQEPVVPDAEPIEVTPELLERFVEVYPAVMGAAQSAQAAMATVETPEEAQRIQSQAQQQITELLTEADLSVQEYEAVVARLNQDEELRAEFEQLLEAHLAGQGG